MNDWTWKPRMVGGGYLAVRPGWALTAVRGREGGWDAHVSAGVKVLAGKLGCPTRACAQAYAEGFVQGFASAGAEAAS